MDMHSGSGCKLKPYEYIYIEAPEAEACVIFSNRFGRSPYGVTCTHCGDDYAIDSAESLEAASARDRDCTWGTDGPDLSTASVALADYVKRADVLVITADQITSEDRQSERSQRW